jgi:hypothetical protein
VRSGGLMELQLPLAALLYPDGGEMLVAGRRALIFFRRLAHDRVVGNDRSIVAERNYFHVIGSQFDKTGVAEITLCRLPVQQLSIDANQREITTQRALEIGSVVLLLGGNEIFLVLDRRLFDRSLFQSAGRLGVGWSTRWDLGRGCESEKNDTRKPVWLHIASFKILKDIDRKVWIDEYR